MNTTTNYASITTIVLQQSQGYGTAVTVDLRSNTFIVSNWDDENGWGNWTLQFSSLKETEECLRANLAPSLKDSEVFQVLVENHDRAHRARIRAHQRPTDVFAYCVEDGSSVLTTRSEAERLGLDYPDRVIQDGTNEHTEVLLKERMLHRVYPDDTGAMDVAILTNNQWCYRDELPEYPHTKVDRILRYGSEPWYQWQLAKFQREGC